MCLLKFVLNIYPLNRRRCSGEYLNLMEKNTQQILHNLHTSSNIIGVLEGKDSRRQDGACSMRGAIAYSYNLVGKPERMDKFGDLDIVGSMSVILKLALEG
jgi:hypothetical protein